jgi:hypothetical protein
MLYRAYPPKLTDQSESTRFYPTAIRQLFTGIYFMELSLAGLFFLVRDAGNNASCTGQAVIMIIVTALTALFHCTLDHGHRLGWLALPAILHHQTNHTRTERRPQLTKSAVTGAAQADPDRDDALSTRPSVLWIPKDKLGISDDEIYDTMRFKSLWISNKGAFLEGGRVKLDGPPPELPHTAKFVAG